MADTAVNVSVSRTPRSTVARLASLARAEFMLAGRNKLVMFIAFLVPILPMMPMFSLHSAGKLDTKMSSLLIGGSMAAILLFVIFVNLVPTFVARREELVLKRLRTGECSDLEILTGIAIPAFSISAVLMLGISLVTVLGLKQAVPVNPLLLLIALAGGCLVFTALSLATSVFTKNSEAAQLTSLPVMLICMLGAGLAPLRSLPGNTLAAMPEWVGMVVQYTPLAPSVELTQLGWSGLSAGGATVDFAGSFAHAWQPTLTLLVWTVIGAVVARKYFRWEPRV